MDQNQTLNDPVSVGKKKQLLQKLLDHLYNKPGRSFHELVNGVKTALGTYKTFVKEWDTLHGIDTSTGASSGASTSGGRGIQDILKNIQQKKVDGSGGPGDMGMAQGNRTGQLGTMPGNRTGQLGVMPGNRMGQINRSPQAPPMPTPQPRQPIAPQAPQVTPQVIPPTTVAPPKTGIPPIQGVRPIMPIDSTGGYNTGYKQPPPVSNLGIYGY